MDAFIQPYQYNAIRRQLNHLLRTVYFVGDYRVYAATRESVRNFIWELFPGMNKEQQSLFDGVEGIQGQSELDTLMSSLTPYVVPFPDIEPTQVRKHFPKVKKLVLPQLEEIPRQKLTYLGWRDVATKSLYVVYPLDGKLVGTECRYVAGQANQHAICSICNEGLPGTEVGLVVAVTKASHYKSVGVHMCLDSMACNGRMTSVDYLDSLVRRWHSR